MIRFAILGCDSSHTEAFARAAHDPSGNFYRDCRIVSIWGKSAEEARRKAHELGIDRVARSPDEALAGVDAALVLSRFADDHFEPGRLALERNLPTFVDKLLTHEPSSSRRLVELAEERNAALASFSPYRFSNELLGFRRKIHECSDESGTLICFGPMDCNDLKGDARFLDPYFYGIHSLEIVFTLLGDEITTVRRLTSADRASALIQFTSGVECSLHLVRGLSAEDYRLTWYSRKASLDFSIAASDPNLYPSAFQGICSELFERGGTRTARCSLKAVEFLDALRRAPP